MPDVERLSDSAEEHHFLIGFTVRPLLGTTTFFSISHQQTFGSRHALPTDSHDYTIAMFCLQFQIRSVHYVATATVTEQIHLHYTQRLKGISRALKPLADAWLTFCTL